MTSLRPGDQLASTTSTTRVVVVRNTSSADPDITCGGKPMVPADSARPQSADAGAVTLIGKRYVDATDAVELLCTFSGGGELCCDGVPMTLKAAKALPASD